MHLLAPKVKVHHVLDEYKVERFAKFRLPANSRNKLCYQSPMAALNYTETSDLACLKFRYSALRI